MKTDVFKKGDKISYKKRFEMRKKLMAPFLKKYHRPVIVHAVHDLRTFEKILKDKKIKLPIRHNTPKKTKYMEKLLKIDNSIFYSLGFIYASAYDFRYNFIFDLNFLKEVDYYSNSIGFKAYKKIAQYWYYNDREYLEKLANKNKTCKEVVDTFINKDYKGKKLMIFDFWRIEKEIFDLINSYSKKKELLKIAKQMKDSLYIRYPASIKDARKGVVSERAVEIIEHKDNDLKNNPYFLGFYIKGKVSNDLIKQLKKDFTGKILFDGRKMKRLR